MRVLYISLVILIIDQVTKLIVKGFSVPFLNFRHEGMYHGQRIPVIGDFFRFTFIENPGMAFGIDPGIDFKLLISVFSIAASAALIFYLYHVRNESKSLRIALAFILGGAAGNLIDRVFYGVFYNYAPLFYGKVVDFLDIDFFDVTVFGRSYDRWPIFNIADSAVTVGVLILLFFYKQHAKADEKKEIDKNKDIETGTDTDNNNDTQQQETAGSTEEIKKEGNTEDGEPGEGKETPL
ncbi:MAG: signal peptidase II [Ignavibacteriaceae bacterium]